MCHSHVFIRLPLKTLNRSIWTQGARDHIRSLARARARWHADMTDQSDNALGQSCSRLHSTSPELTQWQGGTPLWRMVNQQRPLYSHGRPRDSADWSPYTGILGKRLQHTGGVPRQPLRKTIWYHQGRTLPSLTLGRATINVTFRELSTIPHDPGLSMVNIHLGNIGITKRHELKCKEQLYRGTPQQSKNNTKAHKTAPRGTYY